VTYKQNAFLECFECGYTVKNVYADDGKFLYREGVQTPTGYFHTHCLKEHQLREEIKNNE
jgi:hypothetical protein